MWFVFMLAVPRHLRVAYVFISTRLVFKLSLQVCLNFASFVLMIASIGPFYRTSDFDREYLRNGLRYPKSES